MIRHILLAYDGSDSANHAACWAVDLANRYGAFLSVLAVSQPPVIGNDVETMAVIQASMKHYHDVLRQLQQKIAPKMIAVNMEVKVGHPAEQIIEYSEARQIDLIVVGHKGHTLFRRWALGSVSQRVVQYAQCPVLVVR